MNSDTFIVFLAGNTMAIPAIEQLTNNGYKVCVVDKKPCEDCYKVAEKVISADINNYEEVSSALSGINIEAVLPINDFGILTSAMLSKERGLRGWTLENAHLLTSKHLMKKCWVEHKLKTPSYNSFSLEDIESNSFTWDIFPAIVKPSFAGGASRGVFKVNTHDEIISFVQQSKQFYLNDQVVIEEFITGTEHTVEVLINDGACKIISISDKENYHFSPTVVQKLYFPGPIGHSKQKEIIYIVTRACEALGLHFGCAHFEVMSNETGIYLLEVGGRPGGGLNFFPISELSNGHNYPLELAHILSSKGFLLKPKANTTQLGWFFWEGEEGEFVEAEGFDNLRNLPNIIAAEILWKKNSQVLKYFENDMQRPGYFLVSGNSKVEVDNLIESYKTRVRLICL